MPQPTVPADLLTRIARQHLAIDTLETRKSDSFDFHDLPVWRLREALEAAYEAGQLASSVPLSTAGG